VGGLTNVIQVEASYYSTCALKDDGTVWCWGYNGMGELGIGSTTASPSPVQVSAITNAKGLVGGDETFCALLADTTVQCWGVNTSGTCGDGTTTSPRKTSVAVVGTDGTGVLNNVVQLSEGYDHVCARRGDGSVVCWGMNSSGELGDGTTTRNAIPRIVSGLTSVSIAAGKYHNCSLDAAGVVSCWGQNTNGELCDGTVVNRSTPVPVTY
jgi:alpha-tubulin suppressor-like RCC1 family protein